MILLASDLEVVADGVAEGRRTFVNDCAHVQLTAREKEVLAWAARGKTVADTAQILGISPETVEGFVKQSLRKLDAVNKTHGVAKSIALGLIDL